MSFLTLMDLIYAVEYKRRQTVRHDVHMAFFHTMKAYSTVAVKLRKDKNKLYDNSV